MAKYVSRQADLTRLGLSEDALSGISVAKQEAALSSACTIADGFLSERFVLPLVWTFLALASRSTDGQGGAVDIFAAPQVSLALDIVTLTPDEENTPVELTVAIEQSDDGETDWEEVGSFEIPSPLTEAQHLTLELGDNNVDLKRYLRVAWTLAEGSAVFGVSWEGDDLKSAVCAIASLQILKTRGFDPNGPDALWVEEDAKWRKWLWMVHEGKVSPRFIDQTPETEESRPVVRSKKARGWT